jgi:microcystin-dependent protein
LELTGQAVSRTIYSGLFALLGTSYGAGDGTTTFNIPDYRGRTLVGHDASQTEFDVLGETGGAKTHTMTVAEMPVHRHNLQRPPWKTAERTAGNQFWGPAGGPYIQHTDSGSVQFSGGDEPHNNLQPYTVVKWIICAASSSGNFDTEVQTALVTNVSTLQTGQAALQTSVAAIQTRPIISGQIGTFQHPAAPTKLQFDDFFVSGRGITYNATTRRFTVPTAGVYRVTMNPFKFHSTNPVRVTIGVNDDAPTTGNHRGHAYSSGADYQTLSLNSVVTLAANDFVVFYLAQGSLWNLPGDRFNQFSIEMIS